MDTDVDRLLPLQAPRPLEAAASYMLSSLELRSGLEVKALAANAVPLDVLGELFRLQASWALPRARAA